MTVTRIRHPTKDILCNNINNTLELFCFISSRVLHGCPLNSLLFTLTLAPLLEATGKFVGLEMLSAPPWNVQEPAAAWIAKAEMNANAPMCPSVSTICYAGQLVAAPTRGDEADLESHGRSRATRLGLILASSSYVR